MGTINKLSKIELELNLHNDTSRSNISFAYSIIYLITLLLHIFNDLYTQFKIHFNMIIANGHFEIAQNANK